MSARWFVLILIFSLATSSLLAQSKFEVGVEFGATNDLYDFNDPGDHLKKTSLASGSGGVNFRYNLKRNFFLEAAILYRESQFGFRFQSQQGSTATNQDELFMLPVRAGYYIHLSDKIKLSPVAGIAPVYRTFAGSFGASGAYNSNNTTVFYSYTGKDVDRDFFLLLQGGLSLDYIFSGKWRLSFNPNFYYGFKTINIHEMDYTVTSPNNFRVSKSFINGYGSMLQYNFGVRYFLKSKEK